MIAVINYGMGNLCSVSKALETVGAEVKITDNLEEIRRSQGIVLPGVGAFSKGMENLSRKGILVGLLEDIKQGKPFLGICLGLQLLFTQSEEYRLTRGMDVIKGRVRRLRGKIKVPHIGWNQVKIRDKDNVLFKGILDNSSFYFVHSYFVEPVDEAISIGLTEYGEEFTSVIAKDNIFGVQFHPEKSGGLGLKVLENFLFVSSGEIPK